MSAFPIQPLPRWTILPGDPAPLKNWLVTKAAAEAPAGEPEPPDEQEQPRWREAS